MNAQTTVVNPSAVQPLQLAPANSTVNAMPCTLLVDANQMQGLHAQHPVPVVPSGYTVPAMPASGCTFVVDPQAPYRYVCLNCGQARSLQRADTGINPMLLFIGLAMVAGIFLPVLQPPTVVPTPPVNNSAQRQ